MDVDRWVQVLHQRRAIIWIFLFLLVHTKIIPVSAAPPDLASDLTVEAITTTGAKVRWTRTPATTPATIDSYEVSITPSAGISFTPSPTITGTSANPETTISGLTAGVEYTIYVRTVKGTDKGTPKNATFNAKPNPVPNTSLSVTNPQSTTATASWSAPNPPGAFTEYIVSISPNTGGATAVSPVASGTTTSSLTNLIAGNQYTVGVKTKSGMSDSDVVTKTFTTKPIAVGSINDVTVFTTNSATLTWAAVTAGTFTNYVISISPTTGGVTVSPNTVPKGAATTTLLTKLTGGTTYTVTLKTISTDGMESDPVTKQFTTKPDKVDSTSLTVGNTATTTTATLTWDVVTTPFLTYEITISPTAGGAKANPASVAKGTTTAALESLTTGTEYTVTITTKNGGLESDPATMKFRTKPEAVTQGSISFTNVNTISAAVSWTKVLGQVTSYIVTINDPTSSGTPAVNPSSITTRVESPTAALSGLVPGVEYTVTITTISNGATSSAVTKTFRTQPQPVVESNIAVTNQTTTAARVSWDKVAIGVFNTYSISVVPSATITPTFVNNAVQTPTVDLSGLSPGTEYNITLKTVSGGKESDAATKTFTTKPSAVDAGTITFSTSSITLVSATVTWTNVASADAYDVGIQPSTSTTPSITHSPSSATTASFAGLSAGVEYNVSITSKKSDVVGDATFKTFRTKPPNLGGSVVIEAKEMTTATAKWTKPATGTFTNYKITVTPEETEIATPTVTPLTVLSSVQSPSVALSGLVAGQVYTVSVSTNWDGIEGTASTEKFRTKPDKVSNIQIDPLATTTGTIKWTPPTIAAKYTTIYKYQVNIEQPGPTVSPGMVPHPGSSTGVTGMTPGATYKVKVITEAGNGILVVMSDPVEREFTAKPTPVTQNTIVFKNVATKTATATWDKVSVGVSSEYKVGISPTGPTISQNPVPGSTDPPTTALTNLFPGTEYTLTVITVSGTTESTPASATFRTKPMSVSANDVTVTAITTNSATVSWPKITEGLVTSYTVTIDKAGTVTPATVTSLENPSVQLLGMTAGTEYTVTIVTNSGDAKSVAANKKFYTMAEQVTGITVETVTTTTATITWPTVSSGRVDNYSISARPAGATITPSTVSGSVTNPRTSLSQLTPGVQYTITISSIAGNQTATATKANFPFRIHEPHPVSSVDVENVTRNSALLTWDEVDSGVFESYRVSISPTGPTIIPINVSSNETDPSSQISDLSPGVEYMVTVFTVAVDMESQPAVVKFTTKPLPVTGVTLTQNGNKITITWIAGVGSTQSSYKIRYHTIFLNPISAWNDVTLNHPTLTTEISITPGEKYEVEVSAISGDKSSEAAQANLVTAPSPPASVLVNNAAATTTSIEVTWTVTLASYFIQYIINYTKEGTTTPSQVEATSTELKKTIPGLEAGVKYAVQVFTESKESKMSETSADTDGTVKPNCDVVVTDLSTETNKLKARFTASTLVFTNYKFVIANGPKPATKTPPKGTPSTELVYEQGVTPGNKYTLTASCVSNDIESDVKDYFLSSVPAPVTQVDSTPDFDNVLMTIHKPEGTVASVDISCSGPSPGTKNGCTYDKSCFFSTDIICNVKFDNLDSFEDYTFTITVTSNQKKSAPKVVTVKTVHGRPGPASDFKATAQSPTSLKLEWKTPVDPNGEITKYVVEYTGTYKANPSLNLLMDKKNVTFDGLDPNAGSYVKTLEGLKGGYVYELLLYGKTTYRVSGENAATSVTMPTAAPTLVVGAKPPQPLDRKNATSIMAAFSKAFNESNGPILYYSVIVAENKDDDTTLSNPKPGDTIPTWSQVKGISENWPPYMPIRHCDIFDQPKNCQGSPAISRKKRSTSGDTVVIMIGVQDCKNMGIGDFCNGALKPGMFYQIRLRGYTGENKYHDTPYSERIQTSTMHIEPVPTAAGAGPGIAIGLSVTSVIILLIASVVTVVVVARRRKQNKGSKNEQRSQAEVTVENSAFEPIYDDITEPAPVPERETEVMSMVTRYLPNANSKSRAKLQNIFTRLGVTQVKELTYIKENDIVPPLTAIEARMFIEKLQEHERTGGFDEGIYLEAIADHGPAVQHDDFYSNKPRVPNDHTHAKPTAGCHTDALYVNVGGGIAMNAAASGKPESANDTTDGYASLQDFAQPDQNPYAKLGGAVKK